MTGKQLKNSILQWAIQGKLVPQDPNDEPASVLLEKIRAEKARLVKEGKIKKDKKESIIYRGEDNSYYEKFADGKVVCIDDALPLSIPNSWAWCKINNIAFVTKLAGFEYTEHIAGNLQTSGVPLFKGKNVQNGKIIYDFEAYIPELLSDELERSQITKKCLLTPYVGTIGNIGIHNREGKFHLGSNVGKIEILNPINKTYLKEEYLHYYLLSTYGYDELTKHKKATAQESISIDAIRDVYVAVPPTEEQNRICSKIDHVLPFVERYDVMRSKHDKLNLYIFEVLRKSILQEAIQGHIVPQNSSDEPASILLQRIKEEKLRLVAEGKLKKKDVVDSVIFKGDDNRYFEKKGKENIDITEEIPFEIPESWEWCRMGTIGIWGAGSTPAKGNPNYYGGNILWLRTGELNNSVVYDTKIKITQKALEDCSLRMNKIGDVMIAMYGATIGKVAIAGAEMTTNQACCACTPIGIFNWYLFYFLMASQQDFIKKGEGGAQPNISREKLISHMIPIPPLAEQKRIVEKIEQLFAEIEKLKK